MVNAGFDPRIARLSKAGSMSTNHLLGYNRLHMQGNAGTTFAYASILSPQPNGNK